jgi:two-component system, NarL family, invasion response regulator UvrY
MPKNVRENRRRAVAEGGRREIRVLTVDDQAVFRRVAGEVIAATSGFQSVGEAETGEEAVEAVERLRPQLVLLDVRMPGIGGIEASRQITSNHPGTIVVLISIEDPAELAHAIRGSGAAALVRKEDFCPASLRRIWEDHGGAAPS